MFHKTGPGRVEVDVDFSGIGMLQALPWNFDFDDSVGPNYGVLIKARACPVSERTRCSVA
jgi:hypothetical protein